MKKILVFAMAVVMLFSVCAFGISAANIPGDIYTDGSVNAKDAVKLAQHLAGWSIKLTADEEDAADVHADGVLNSKDAVKLAQHLAGWDVTLGSGSTGTVPDTGDNEGGYGDIEIPAGGFLG